MNAIVRVLTQYHENYNTDNGVNANPNSAPYWKPKGGVEFEVEVNSDIVLYCDNIEEILTTMVNEQCNPMCKYTYMSHEVNFSKPSKLSSNRFKELARDQFNNK